MTSFCLCAADCMGWFQKETGDFIDLPFRGPRADLFQEAAEGAPSTSRPRDSRVDDEKLVCIHVLIVKWTFQWLLLFIIITEKITCNTTVMVFSSLYERILSKMYGISHVASTAGTSSTAFNGEDRRSFSHLFPSYACPFLDDDPVYECHSANPLTGSLPTCRRSPRLLSNGYYILTEDSFLSDEEGNITMTPSQTSITYKENLVRIFKRRKKIHHSLASLFSLDASSPWLSSTVLGDTDSSHVDDPWPDGCSKPGASESDIGNSDFSSEYNSHVPQRQTSASHGVSLLKDEELLQPGKPFCSPINANEETLNNAESSTVKNVLSQMVGLIMCLIISICTRYFLGGLSATLLLIILVFLLSQDAAVLSFFSLETSFKTTKFG
ncbi:PREDICTED: transmembrane protein 71 [Chaetura pelagica]|uniref:transmembrane protein 71 n=1 Tax=Chaetura pelagica TaxID=8897 RepID=UPI0005233E70|nr:PREDICTED: transmembrane protein 71 [Chaetura pelagica]